MQENAHLLDVEGQPMTAQNDVNFSPAADRVGLQAVRKLSLSQLVRALSVTELAGSKGFRASVCCHSPSNPHISISLTRLHPFC